MTDLQSSQPVKEPTLNFFPSASEVPTGHFSSLLSLPENSITIRQFLKFAFLIAVLPFINLFISYIALVYYGITKSSATTLSCIVALITTIFLSLFYVYLVYKEEMSTFYKPKQDQDTAYIKSKKDLEVSNENFKSPRKSFRESTDGIRQRISLNSPNNDSFLEDTNFFVSNSQQSDLLLENKKKMSVSSERENQPSLHLRNSIEQNIEIDFDDFHSDVLKSSRKSIQNPLTKKNSVSISRNSINSISSRLSHSSRQLELSPVSNTATRNSFSKDDDLFSDLSAVDNFNMNIESKNEILNTDQKLNDNTI